jgi:protein-arginine kinase activator protein McsA
MGLLDSQEKRPCKKCGFSFTRLELRGNLMCSTCFLHEEMPLLLKVNYKNVTKVENKEKVNKDLKLKFDFADDLIKRGFIDKERIPEFKEYLKSLGNKF